MEMNNKGDKEMEPERLDRNNVENNKDLQPIVVISTAPFAVGNGNNSVNQAKNNNDENLSDEMDYDCQIMNQSKAKLSGNNDGSQNGHYDTIGGGNDSSIQELNGHVINKMSRKNSGEGSEHLQPTLEEPETQEQTSSPFALLTCIFCTKSYLTETDMADHIKSCNPPILKIVRLSKKQCRVCLRVIKSFNINGLIRHSMTCVIEDWSLRVTRERDLKNLPKLEPQIVLNNNSSDHEENQKTDEEDDQIESEDVSEESVDSQPINIKKRLRGRRGSGAGNGSLSENQKEILEQAFKKYKFPSVANLRELSSQTGLANQRIKGWFKKRTSSSFQQGNLRLKQQQQRVKSLRRTDRSSIPINQTPLVTRGNSGAGRPFPDHISEQLKSVFARNKNPSEEEKRQLCADTGLTYTQVHRWFFDRKNHKHYNRGLDRKPKRHYRKSGQTDRPSSSNVHLNIKLESSPNLEPGRAGGRGIKFPDEVVQLLQSVIDIKMYLTNQEFDLLESATGLTAMQLREWFINRRRNYPKETRKSGLEASHADTECHLIKDLLESSKFTKIRGNFANASATATAPPVLDTPSPKKYSRALNRNASGSSKKTPPMSRTLPIGAIKSFRESYDENPNPHFMEVLRLSQLTGIESKTIKAWFSEMRRGSCAGSSERKPVLIRRVSRVKMELDDKETVKTFNVSTSSYDGDCPSDREDYEMKKLEEFVGKPEIVQTSRQKIATISQTSMDDLNEALQKSTTNMRRLLCQYHDAGHGRMIFDDETELLSPAFQFSNPFTIAQENQILRWQEDFAVQMYPEKNEEEWRKVVDTYCKKILRFWQPVWIYGHILNMTLEEAAAEIHQLSLTRSQRLKIDWQTPELLKIVY